VFHPRRRDIVAISSRCRDQRDTGARLGALDGGATAPRILLGSRAASGYHGQARHVIILVACVEFNTGPHPSSFRSRPFQLLHHQRSRAPLLLRLTTTSIVISGVGNGIQGRQGVCAVRRAAARCSRVVLLSVRFTSTLMPHHPRRSTWQRRTRGPRQCGKRRLR
jgi:hypothetical protein